MRSEKSERRRSLEERQRLLSLWRKSGLSRPAFCRKQGIAYTTLCNWLQREGIKENRPRFREVRISPLAALGESVAAEICLVNGVRIRWMRGGETSVLEGILEVASRCGN